MVVGQPSSPDLALDAIELVPRGQPFAVGADYLEPRRGAPVRATPRRPVVISIDGDAAGVAVEVDRGVATYVQPVPSEDEGAVAGWGRRARGHSYVEVAALPSATLTVNQDDKELGQVGWADLEAGQTGREGRGPATAGGPGPELGPRPRPRRPNRAPGPVPSAFPQPRRSAVPAARSPQPRQLQPRHLAHRRRAATSGSGTSPTPTSTAPARDGCREATSSSTWPEGSSTPPCTNAYVSSPASAS